MSVELGRDLVKTLSLEKRLIYTSSVTWQNSHSFRMWDEFQNSISQTYLCIKAKQNIFRNRCINDQHIHRKTFSTSDFFLEIIFLIKKVSINLKQDVALGWPTNWTEVMINLITCSITSKSLNKYAFYLMTKTSFIFKYQLLEIQNSLEI